MQGSKKNCDCFGFYRTKKMYPYPSRSKSLYQSHFFLNKKIQWIWYKYIFLWIVTYFGLKIVRKSQKYQFSLKKILFHYFFMNFQIVHLKVLFQKRHSFLIMFRRTLCSGTFQWAYRRCRNWWTWILFVFPLFWMIW